ncbi:MAG: hypothetical protein CR997_11915 [Acidobacteria bacterium]|nr:MAG: hypothetical protein CR997_11915 [Acidobacteriota bacterium]
MIHTLKSVNENSCFFLFLDGEDKIKKGSESLLSYAGFEPESYLGRPIKHLIPTFNAENNIQIISTGDGKTLYMSCYREAWQPGAFALRLYSESSKSIDLLMVNGESLLSKMNSHHAVQHFSESKVLNISHFNQFFSSYYDLLVRFSGDHNSFSWHTPEGFSTHCSSQSLLGLLATLQSYRIYLDASEQSLHVSIVPFQKGDKNGFKLIASQPNIRIKNNINYSIASYYLWLRALQLGFAHIEFQYESNGQDIFSFIFFEKDPVQKVPPLLIGQRTSWFSDMSLWLLRYFQFPGVRFFDMAETFVQNAVCCDPKHALLLFDFGSFSSEEIKIAFKTIKEHESGSIAGIGEHISRVPTHWRGPVFIQKGSLAANLDRLFSFYNKSARSLDIRYSRL